MTPHHIICQAKCDNHELLDLIIACFGRSLINSKSYDGSTTLLHAVKNANLKCSKSLIANGANVNLEDASYPCYSSLSSSQHTLSPLIETIKRLQPNSEYSSVVMTDIFDLLLGSGVNVNKPKAFDEQCVKKLIEKGARLDTTDHDDVFTWSEVARMGSVELLKCMLDHGVDKECTDMEGQSLLSYTVLSGEVEAIRYALDLCVTMTSSTPVTDEISCTHCGKSRLLIDIYAENEIKDPHMVACE